MYVPGRRPALLRLDLRGTPVSPAAVVAFVSTARQGPVSPRIIRVTLFLISEVLYPLRFWDISNTLIVKDI